MRFSSAFPPNREISKFELQLAMRVVDKFVHTGNARLEFVFQQLSACNASSFPNNAAMVFALVASTCAQQLDTSWREGDPAMIWRATDKLPVQFSSTGNLRHFFTVDEPALSRYDLLGRLVTALALEQAALVTDDPECGRRWDAGRVLCISGALKPEDAFRAKNLRTPAMVLDL